MEHDGCDGTCPLCIDEQKLAMGWTPPAWWPDEVAQREQERLDDLRQQRAK